MPVEVEYARCSQMDRLRQVCGRYVESRSHFAQKGATSQETRRRYRDSSYLLAQLCLTWAGDRAGDRNPPREAMTCWFAWSARDPERR